MDKVAWRRLCIEKKCTPAEIIFFPIHTKFYSQYSAADIAHFSPFPKARSRLYTLYEYNTNYINFNKKNKNKTGNRKGKIQFGTGVEILTNVHTWQCLNKAEILRICSVPRYISECKVMEDYIIAVKSLSLKDRIIFFNKKD